MNRHIESARERAAGGSPYVLQLPLSNDLDWLPDTRAYWEHFGDAIGTRTEPIAPPATARHVLVRATAVRPDIVRSIHPMDLNIVTERLTRDRTAGGFDLIAATNVLVYYDTFDQALALANVASMLRPGGYFLSNYRVSPGAPLESAPSQTTQVFWDRRRNGDTMFAYRAY